MSLTKKVIFSGVSLLFLSVAFVVLLLKLTEPELDKLPALRNGDIIFQTDTSHQALPIIVASHSAYSHTAIIKIMPDDGEVRVVEAVQPVQETRFDQWVSRGLFQRLTIKRVKDLPHEQGAVVVKHAQSYMGKNYDIYFLPDDERIYCSELVRKAFDRVNISLGEWQKVGDLRLDSPVVQRLIEERWHRYPACIKAKAQHFDECLKVIKAQELITPESIAEDGKLETLYSNYGIFQ